MILSDRDIRKRLKEGGLVIEPLGKGQIQPASVDLRLGSIFRVFLQTEKVCIDPVNDKDDNYTRLKEVEEGKPFIIHPGEFVLGATIEKVRIPGDLVGRLDGRSSIGRLGVIVHSTAGFCDPGFEGRLTLEMTNIGKIPVALYPGMRVCQISLHQLSSPSEIPYNRKKDAKYMGDKGPGSSKMHMDIELS